MRFSPGKLVNIQGSYGILDYGCQPYARHGHLSVNQLKNQSYRQGLQLQSQCSLKCLSCSFGQNQKVNIAVITMTGKRRYKVDPLKIFKSLLLKCLNCLPESIKYRDFLVSAVSISAVPGLVLFLDLVWFFTRILIRSHELMTPQYLAIVQLSQQYTLFIDFPLQLLFLILSLEELSLTGSFSRSAQKNDDIGCPFRLPAFYRIFSIAFSPRIPIRVRIFTLSLVFLVSGASFEASYETSFASVLFDFALRER